MKVIWKKNKMEIDKNKIYSEICERIGNDKFAGIVFDFLVNEKLLHEFI